MTTLAVSQASIPIVASAADRDARFPVPTIDKRVFNKTTVAIERWNGITWLTDFSQNNSPGGPVAWNDVTAKPITRDGYALSDVKTHAENLLLFAPLGSVGGGGGGPTFNTAVKVYTQGIASTRAADTPAFRVTDSTGNSFRAFGVWADEAIAHIGPIPRAIQWQSGALGAPAGSAGPVKKINSATGLHIYNGPTGGDSNFYLIANAVIDDTYGGGAGGGPNQQTGIGLVGATSQGKIRINMVTASSDGGWRFLTNRYFAPQFSMVGNATLNGTNVTFSASQAGVMHVGEAFWLMVPANSYGPGSPAAPIVDGFTLKTFNGTTGATLFDNIAVPFTAAILFGTANPQADPNRGSIKWGTDSTGRFFGVQYQQPVNSAYAQVDFLADYNFFIYPGGFDTANMGFGKTTDIGVQGKDRSFGIFTSSVESAGAMKRSVTYYPYFAATNAPGPVEYHSQVRFNGGLFGAGLGSRPAPIQIAPQDSDPGTLFDGIMWVIAGEAFMYLDGAKYSINLTPA